MAMHLAIKLGNCISFNHSLNQPCPLQSDSPVLTKLRHLEARNKSQDMHTSTESCAFTDTYMTI